MADDTNPKVEFCLGKEIQETSNFSELIKHVGHTVRIIAFPRGLQILKVSMECVTCNRVLIEYDNPDYEA